MNRDKIVDYLHAQFEAKKEYERMPENEIGYTFIPREALYKIVDGLIPMVKGEINRVNKSEPSEEKNNMVIEPTYVTFQQAKFLRDKGFNVPLRKVYNTLGQLWDSHYGTMSNDDIDSGASCTAPEQWQVVEWLRIQHGILVRVESDCYGQRWFAQFSTCSEKRWMDMEGRYLVAVADRQIPECASPQEAYSLAFDYTLKNLI
jgi:hypothetical protein